MGSVYLRGKTYWIKFYRDGKPVRESAKTEKASEAKDLLKQRLGESVTGKYVGLPASRIRMEGLFQMVIDDYVRYDRRDLYQVRYRIKLHLNPRLGHMKAAQFGTDQINQYISYRKQERAQNSTINRELSIIRRAFSLASQQHPPKVEHIPPISKLPEDNVRTGFIEHEQYERLRNRLRRAVTPLVIGYHLGLRKGAILGLEWSMIDLKAAELRLPARLSKNKKAQTCPLYGELLEHLKQRRAETPATCKWVCNDDGKPIKSFKGEWEAAVKDCGMPGMIFHDLRRSAVRNMVRAGVPEIVAMAMSGHKTKAIFDRYNIVSGRDIRDAAGAMERYSTAQQKTDTEG